ncbi:MAG TPA: peptidase M1, partial [Terriglobales bacterium]
MAALVVLATPAFAQRQRLRVDSYVIDADITPAQHRLAARAKVTVTALDSLNTLPFELHNGLRVTKVLDERGHPIAASSIERVTQESSIRVNLPSGLAPNQSTTLTFDYEGILNTADDSPVEGLKLAHVGDDETYLLYAGRWFPMVGYGTNRFTATMNITVPSGLTVIASGTSSAPKPAGPGKVTYTFTQNTPSFPGT